MKSPYTFPHRSRKAMIEYLMDRRTYTDHYAPYIFAWNVKAHFVNWNNPQGEYVTDPAFDMAWCEHLEAAGLYGPEYQAFEDARCEIEQHEWTSYPGDDQGEWKLYFAGRQAGWIVLEEWRGYRIGGKYREEIRDQLEELDLDQIRAFYRGIRTADNDFTPAKASKNVEYHLNRIRHEWEQEQKAEKEERNLAFAAALMESRPDMYA